MSDRGFTPIWIVLARFMASQCRRCHGHGFSMNDTGWDEKGNAVTPPCPDCREIRDLIKENPNA